MITPPPVTACAVVMYAALLHVIEAAILALSGSADGSLPLAALLAMFPNRALLVTTMLISAALALSTLAKPPLSARATALALLPQQALLLVTAAAAWLAVWHGHYGDGLVRPTLFITADQLPRGLFSLIHVTAVASLAIRRSGARH